jgi:FkbM family methyltransferase
MSVTNWAQRIIAKEKRLRKVFSSALPLSVEIPFPDGSRIFIDPRDVRGPSFHIARELFSPEVALEGYEPRERKLIHQAFRKRNGKGVFLDIGANIGLYSIPLALEFPEVEIHAFEPHPVNARCLRNSIQANGFQSLHLYEVGLANVTGQADLFLDETDSGGHSLLSTNMWNNKNPSVGVPVSLLPLDKWFQEKQLQRLDVVKIDVQGAEPDVFEGGMAALQKFQPEILIEIQFDGLLARDEVLNQLRRICPDYQFRNMEDEIWRPIGKLRDDIQRRSDEGYLISDYFFAKSIS